MGAKRDGWSLLEMLLAIAVLAVLSVLSVPALHHLWQRQQLHMAADALAHSLQLARMESQGRGRAVTLCPSVDGRKCAFDAGLEQGWVILLEPSLDRFEPQPLQVQAGWPGLRINASSSLGEALRFNAQGWLRTRSGAPAFGDIVLCADSNESGLKLIVSRAGRIRREDVVCQRLG